VVKDFRHFQFEFARHLRQPHLFPKPEGVSPQSVEIYQRARFARVKEVLALVFVRSHTVLGNQAWSDLVEHFYWHWPTHGTRQNHLPYEFVCFLSEYPASEETPAWFANFVRFEWMQWRVSAMDAQIPSFNPTGDLMRNRVVLNPAREDASFDWPVHGIEKESDPIEPSRTVLWVLRTLDDSLSVVPSDLFQVQLISLLKTGMTGEQALAAMAAWLNHTTPQTLLAEGAELLNALRQSQMILGTAVE
jgi:hypothetical protein